MDQLDLQKYVFFSLSPLVTSVLYPPPFLPLYVFLYLFIFLPLVYFLICACRFTLSALWLVFSLYLSLFLFLSLCYSFSTSLFLFFLFRSLPILCLSLGKHFGKRMKRFKKAFSTRGQCGSAAKWEKMNRKIVGSLPCWQTLIKTLSTQRSIFIDNKSWANSFSRH